MGRFISRDPIGYEVGNNVYHCYYALNAVDPLGLRTIVGGDPTQYLSYEFDIPGETSPWKRTHCGMVGGTVKGEAYDVLGVGGWIEVEGWLCRCCNTSTGEKGWAAGARLKAGVEVGLGIGGNVEIWGLKFAALLKGPTAFHELELASITKRCDGVSKLSVLNWKMGTDFRIELGKGGGFGLSGYIGGRVGAEFQSLNLAIGDTFETSYVDASAGGGVIESKLKITGYFGIARVDYEKPFLSAMMRLHFRKHFIPLR